MKNTQKVFFITILLMLLIGLSTISASDETTTDSITSDMIHIEQTNVQKDTAVIKNTTKEIKKTEKNEKYENCNKNSKRK